MRQTRKNVPLSIPKDELLQLVRSIEAGEIILNPKGIPQQIYAGPVEYEATNGWELAVFNDANEWDYFEWILSPDGRRVDYDELFDAKVLENYSPPGDLAWLRYGIRGHMKFRCLRCGEKCGQAGGKFLCRLCQKSAA